MPKPARVVLNPIGLPLTHKERFIRILLWKNNIFLKILKSELNEKDPERRAGGAN